MKLFRLPKQLVGGATGVLDEESPRKRLCELARTSGDPFRGGPYYDVAEPDMDHQWDNLIWPMLEDKGIDFHCVLDLAAGHGRNSAKLRRHADRIIIVDINQENIDACQKRFRGDDRFVFIKNDGVSLAPVKDGSVTFIYTFDSMVHFDSDVVREYLKEFRRVLKPGGHGFCHHSNYTGSPGGDFRESPHWRNFMSKELLAHYCAKEGLAIVEQRVIDWTCSKLDCLSVLQKPMN
jgi:ubiquinone/menaquinone biosynthesis C-methylase UbiE